MKALVTGGGGFLGKVIVRMLLDRGTEVRTISRSAQPGLGAMGVEHVIADISDEAAMIKAADGCDIIYHVAAKAGIWGPYDEYYRANVVGTKNVINACHANGIKKLVYTSSPSVVFDGSDMEGVDESVPYPDHFEACYPETKAKAEQMILKANSDKLATVALRPHLIWGPEDNHLVPRIIEKGKKGALRKIGNRQSLVDTIYVDNAAEAHILAADRLDIDSPVAGKTYFISQGEPRPLWDVVNQILEAGCIPPVDRSISPGLAYAIGWVLEKAYSAFSIKGEPRMTRFLAGELSTSHWFDISAAKRDFDYKASISYEEGMSRLKDWLTTKQD